MRLRVMRTAKKGHLVAGVLYGPGEELPSEYPAVPKGLEARLESTDAVPVEPSRHTAKRPPPPS